MLYLAWGKKEGGRRCIVGFIDSFQYMHILWKSGDIFEKEYINVFRISSRCFSLQMLTEYRAYNVYYIWHEKGEKKKEKGRGV